MIAFLAFTDKENRFTDLDTINEDFWESVSTNHVFSVNQATIFIR